MFLMRIFLFFLFFSPFKAFGHSHSPTDREIDTALQTLEKALLFTSDFPDTRERSAAVPFYEINGHRVYLDEGFWLLTRAWLKIYIEEIEKRCPCDLDPDLMLEEAKDYIPQSFLGNMGKKYGQPLLSSAVAWTGRYGLTAAMLKLSAEAAETALVLSFGLHFHFLCNAIDVLIVVWVRKIQKYIRAFSYGSGLNAGALRTALKFAWLFRRVKKRQKAVYFYMAQALAFKEGEPAAAHPAGRRNHQLLWIENLKRKTDPLFERIAEWEEKKEQALSPKERKALTKKIERAKKKIESISKVNRKDFFGSRFKSFLFLKAKRLSGHSFQDRVLGKGALWPLSLQENIMEKAFEPSSSLSPEQSAMSALPSSSSLSPEQSAISALPSSSSSRPEQRGLERYRSGLKSENSNQISIEPDEIREGLIEEFLLKRDKVQSLQKETGKKNFLHSLLWDIDQIFNTELPSSYRLMKVEAMEEFLSAVLFALYFNQGSEILSKKYKMSFRTQLKLRWAFNRFFNSADDFFDFLSVVSTIKNKKKIAFYKYESMEKLLAVFDYFHEARALMKTDRQEISEQILFERLHSKHSRLQSLSLSTGKQSLSKIKTASQILPFAKALPQCVKLVEKYQ